MADLRALLNDPDFVSLCRRRNRISAVLTALTLLVYYGFIFLLAFDRDFFGRKISERITVGIPIGIGVIVVSWILTGIYVAWANSRYDAMVARLKGKLTDGGPPGST
jgi:uncharacterized membrane protein (DUF485 family)